MNDFQDELQSLINKHSQENGSDTPDFILASYLNDCLKAFNVAVSNRETWYGRNANSVKDSEGEGVGGDERPA